MHSARHALANPAWHALDFLAKANHPLESSCTHKRRNCIAWQALVLARALAVLPTSYVWHSARCHLSCMQWTYMAMHLSCMQWTMSTGQTYMAMPARCTH